MKESRTGTIKTSRNPRARISPRRTMEESTTSSIKTGPVAGIDKSIFHTMEEGWQALGRGTWHLVHAFPGHGTIPGFAVGLGAAMLVGVAELAAGCFTAYVSYRMFAYGESLSEAIENAIKFESGKLRKKEIDRPVPE